ncbi:MAG: hypothetical protein P8Y70_11375, partial [Candidatus Lokiarchaeota archaeon]
MDRLHKIGFSKLTSVNQALDTLFKNMSKVGEESVDINHSLNRILAEDIICDIDVPPFDKSAMDGYAIKAEDSFGASPKNPKILNVRRPRYPPSRVFGRGSICRPGGEAPRRNRAVCAISGRWSGGSGR